KVDEPPPAIRASARAFGSPTGVARALQVEVGALRLKQFPVMHDKDARPVQRLIAPLSPERSRLLMDMTVEKVNTLGSGQVVHEECVTVARPRSVAVAR